MKILKQVYKEIVTKIPLVPPESGGILGECNGIICHYRYDLGEKQELRNSYSPSIDVLNDQIAEWNGNGIRFVGMYHSHPEGQTTLSAADHTYIGQIMDSMPKETEFLFFPLVLPRKRMIGFLAKRESKGVMITPEEIELK